MKRSRLKSGVIATVVVLYIIGLVSYFSRSPTTASLVRGKESGDATPEWDKYKRENASLVVLCRNEDLSSITRAIMSIEGAWNHRYGYPYIFINNEEFTPKFKNVTSLLVREAHYDVAPETQWTTPEWIDEEKATKGREYLQSKNIIYADSVPYRHMCRFFAGFFYKSPSVQNYKYLMRLDNDVTHLCQIPYDPFRLMRESGKRYGFVIAAIEFMDTVATLWEDTLKFLEYFPQYVSPNNLAQFVSDDDGASYNGCHFWTNFEVVDADFYREEAYTNYFEFLDHMGGFYYERWGDAPVHAIAASLFLDRDEIHFFEDMGYLHPPFQHVPENFIERGLRCFADPGISVDWEGFSCLKQYYVAQGIDLPPGVSA